LKKKNDWIWPAISQAFYAWTREKGKLAGEKPAKKTDGLQTGTRTLPMRGKPL
jgi:hypothetical protein